MFRYSLLDYPEAKCEFRNKKLLSPISKLIPIPPLFPTILTTPVALISVDIAEIYRLIDSWLKITRCNAFIVTELTMEYLFPSE